MTTPESSARFTFVHGADLHLDTPFEGMGRVTPAVAEVLRDASLKALDALVALARERDAAFVLLAGDIYDGPRRGVRAQLRFLRAVERLSEHGIPVFVVHGNHDPVGGWTAVRTWPPLVTVFGASRVETAAVERDGRRLATIYGISYGEREVTRNLAKRFKRVSAPGLHVGLLHCNAGGDVEHGSYAPCSPEDLRIAGLDYWALGHLHRRRILADGGPWIVYPGNLQGRSLKPSECGPKGASLVTVEDGAVASVEHASLDGVRFVCTELEVDESCDLAALRSRIAEAGHRLRAEHGGRHLVIRVTLSGCGPAAHDVKRPGAVEALLRDMREEAEELDPFLWWESLRDATRALDDLDVIRRRGDFSAELVRLSDELAADRRALESFTAERFASLPWARLRRWLPGAGAAVDPAELAQARDAALDLLEEDE